MKKELKQILNNPTGKLIAVDVDKTLTLDTYWGNENPRPNKTMVDFVNNLWDKMAHIIIYTARKREFYTATEAWLIEHGVNYHGIIMRGKPPADVYIDDSALNVDDI